MKAIALATIALLGSFAIAQADAGYGTERAIDIAKPAAPKSTFALRPFRRPRLVL